ASRAGPSAPPMSSGCATPRSIPPPTAAAPGERGTVAVIPLLRTSTALRARVALRPASVVLTDRFGELTAAELLDQVRLLAHRPHRAARRAPSRGLRALPPDAALRQVLLTV